MLVKNVGVEAKAHCHPYFTTKRTKLLMPSFFLAYTSMHGRQTYFWGWLRKSSSHPTPLEEQRAAAESDLACSAHIINANKHIFISSIDIYPDTWALLLIPHSLSPLHFQHFMELRVVHSQLWTYPYTLNQRQ